MAAIVPLLGSLPFSHPSNLPLLESHKPFSRPSSLPQSSLSKYIGRLNTLLLSRDDGPDRKSACALADAIVRQDDEGWVMTNYGKGWVGACLSSVASNTTPLAQVPVYLSLLTTLVLSASQYPSFEREVIHPIMGKLSVSLGKLFERSLSESQPDWDIVLDLLSSIRVLLLHSPANFRPMVPTLRPALLTLILQLPTSQFTPPAIPAEVRRAAADLVASLHVTAGKAQAPQSWGTEMKDALGGFGRAMSGITADAWEAEPVKVTPPAAAAGLPELPVDPMARLPAALDWAEGYVEVILALLRYPTSRPVPVPIAQITVSYISPQHHAALLAALPRIWTAGLQLLGGLALACGDHIFPHLGGVLDHTVWLAERLPSSMFDSQLRLFKFHRIILTLFPPALVTIEYPSRLLRLCLTRLQPLLENKTKVNDLSSAAVGGKRGKKRARGAEDGLVGGLEGREGRTVEQEDAEVILEAVRLISVLHTTPLLSPSLLTFSIRLHLSLHLSLPSAATMFSSPEAHSEVVKGVATVLENAVCMTEGEHGTGRGWKTLIISVLDGQSHGLTTLLHPFLPPLQRPMPPLSQLHFFVNEGEEERKERLGMGYGLVDDPVEEDEELGEPSTLKSSNRPPVQRQHQQQQPLPTPAVPAPVLTQPAAPIAPVPAPVVPKLPSAPAALLISSISQELAVPAPSQSAIKPATQATLGPEAVTTPSAEVAIDLISAPTTTRELVTKTVVEGLGSGDVIMLNDDDDEGIPELDSGSDEDELEDDDDEEEEEIE
ncbi:hypothetical protein IAU60_001548 [Kwoniella sp. DSM 27419]